MQPRLRSLAQSIVAPLGLVASCIAQTPEAPGSDSAPSITAPSVAASPRELPTMSAGSTATELSSTQNEPNQHAKQHRSSLPPLPEFTSSSPAMPAPMVPETAAPAMVHTSGTSPPCPNRDPTTLREANGPVEHFSVHGYVARGVLLQRVIAGVRHVHCVAVGWPPGKVNRDGAPSRVAEHIDEAWFRAITNTLERIPFHHATLVRRIVVDNRPKQHGIAAFDRKSPDDARDGHTIWLHEHLFRSPNHWARGNLGEYHSYHTNHDGTRFDDQDPEHDLFSPILLHEIGHLVMYHLVNAEHDSPSTPDCARTCADEETCESLTRKEQEHGCISPYCRPFGFPGSTENWAEQYRFYYQSAETRELLVRAGNNCLPVLEHHDARQESPWQRGLAQDSGFSPSRWDSCGGRACKPW